MTPGPSLKTLKIVSAFMMFSSVLLVVVNFMINSQVYGGPGLFEFFLRPEFEMLAAVLGLMALVLMTISLMAPKIFNRPKRLSENLSTPSGTERSALFFDWKHFNPQMYTTTIVRLALAESIGIFGFVLAFLNHAFLNMLPFTLLSLMVQVLVSPFYDRHGVDL